MDGAMTCTHCTREIRMAEPTEQFGGRWVHVHSDLPWCLLKRGEA